VGHRHHRVPDPSAAAVLDIGGEVGALLLFMPADLAGAEIELQPLAGGPRTHTGVHARRVGDAVVHAALYPALAAGSYAVLLPGDPDRLTVLIEGGRVTEADCR
jgi:hypothetical protein